MIYPIKSNQLTFAFKDDLIARANKIVSERLVSLLRLIQYGISRAEEIDEYEHVMRKYRELVSPLLKIGWIIEPVSTSKQYDLLDKYLYPTRYTYVYPEKEDVLLIGYDIHKGLKLLDSIKADNFKDEEQRKLFGLIIAVDKIHEQLIKLLDNEKSKLSRTDNISE